MSRARSLLAFHAVRTEGGLLPQDILQRIALEDKALPGLTPDAYNLSPGERLRDAVNRAWSRLTVAWRAFQSELAKLKEGDRATTVTRKRWLLPLFKELDFGQLNEAPAVEIEGKRFAISHTRDSVPIHLVGCRVDLDTRDKQTGGSPHGLVQDFLNRSDAHLWGFVSNGYILRILRDHHSLTQQAYVEFDLQAIMEGEAFSEFLLLWLLCNQSRVGGTKPEECWLEKWFGISRDEGVRALERLRAGVEQAIVALGTGFLKQKQANKTLHQKLESADLHKQDYYRQLLRLAYRLIFLFVAEDRGALLDPRAPETTRARYEGFYTTKRLRDLADKRRGGPHGDLWQQLRLVMNKLENGSPELGLPALGSFLWSERAIRDLNGLELANEDLLGALRALCYTEQGKARYSVSWRNMGAEELGSVYESLLELHPNIHKEAARFELSTAAGHERKTTGSYYTPTSLVDCLLDSALEPVLDEAVKKADPEKAILDLKVCDPACGSGHFLVAAARRMAMRLARVRAGEEEPSPPEVQRALRDVVGRCIYGVDLNPMAAELCKVSLWMEAIEPGKPLSFLEGHIREGNALLGATPALMAKGIPDEAFEVIEVDDKEVAKRLKKRNKKARETGQLGLEGLFVRGAPKSTYVRLTSAAVHVEEDKDEDISAMRKKEADWEQLTASEDFRKAMFLADAWCAAFVLPKQKGQLEEGAITEDLWRRMEKDYKATPPVTKREVNRLAREYSFFHWHLAFPQVFFAGDKTDEPEDKTTGWSGGFDVVLGNPPWDQVELSEDEFFASRDIQIAAARKASDRKRLIASLIEREPELYRKYKTAMRVTGGGAQLLSSSGRFPLCGHGRVNTYAVFAELNRSIAAPSGAVGCIVPTGIATDSSTSMFFRALVDNGSIRSLYDFSNDEGLFPAVRPHQHFCLLTLRRRGAQDRESARYAFFLTRPQDISGGIERTVALTKEDISLINPNTRTLPVFRNSTDAELMKDIYRRIPVLIRGEGLEENPWQIWYSQGLFNMASDSELFVARAALQAPSGTLSYGRIMVDAQGRRHVPLFDAKMAQQFNHRAANLSMTEHQFRKIGKANSSAEDLDDPNYEAEPAYWVSEQETELRLKSWRRQWLLGFKDVTGVTSTRLASFAIIPRCGVGHPFPLLFSGYEDVGAHVVLLAIFNSIVVEYVLRLKMQGLHLTWFLLKQLPVPPPDKVIAKTPWARAVTYRDWLALRALELTATSWSISELACDLIGRPCAFRWNESRRALLRAELDAACLHLYGVHRRSATYMLDSLEKIRERDEREFQTYRTKTLILDAYDRMQRAIDTGEPYKTLLDSPPANPRVAHPARNGAS